MVEYVNYYPVLEPERFMAKQNTLEQSYLALVEFLLLSKRRVFELGSEFSLTGMQAMMLFMLDRPRSMHSFKQTFNCDASNITGLVDGLEQKKLASRYENSDDRRVKMVELLPLGRRTRSALLRQLTSHGSPLLSRLSTNELRTFIELLHKLTSDELHV